MDEDNFTGLLCIEAQQEASTVAAVEGDGDGTIIFLVVAVGIGGKAEQLCFKKDTQLYIHNHIT